jgi:carboxyl-terminal processing protease
MRKPWRITATSLFLTATLAGALLGDKLLARAADARDSLRTYTELVTLAHERYGSEVDYRELVFAAIQGMLRTLDPHTSFLPPKAYTGMRERQQATFYGLGILVSVRNGQLTVMSPIEGTPAARLGMRAGDVISTIEGEPTETMSLDEAVDRLKGPKGTQVSIEVVRRGLTEPLRMTVTRDEIPQTTVRFAFLLDADTGYVRLTDFNRSSSEEVAHAIADLKAKGMKRLLFDLRNNGGGLLDQAIDVADQFVPRGSQIVETRGRTPESVQSYEAAGSLPPLGEPVVVLVNRGTASASEIVSGAIQDHDTGLVVGTPTWGKGLVQTVYNLPYGSGLALTTAKYYTPSGRLIQRDYSSYYDYVSVGDDLADAAAAPSHPGAAAYHTDLGRDVFGGGGITPDVLVEGAEVSLFNQYLLSRNAFLNFAIDYGTGHPVSGPDWRPGPDLLPPFEKWLVDEGVADDGEAQKRLAEPGAGDFAVLMIGSEILNTRFGVEAQQRALLEGDPQVERARELFGDAAQLLARRQQLEESAPERQARATLN